MIRALKVRRFRSDHIADLGATRIAYPGYHPSTANDWVHTDADESHNFPSPGDIHDAPDDGPPFLAAHEALRGHVAGGRLWYALLHCWPTPEEDEADEDDSDLELDRHRNHWVMLFAVGKSKDGKRLVGVITHQACHNFCD